MKSHSERLEGDCKLVDSNDLYDGDLSGGKLRKHCNGELGT